MQKLAICKTQTFALKSDILA